MGLLKKAADTVYAFRFIRMLVLDWKDWDAYKEGIIDENGKRVRVLEIDNLEKSSSWTPFIRLCANVKKSYQKHQAEDQDLEVLRRALSYQRKNWND